MTHTPLETGQALPGQDQLTAFVAGARWFGGKGRDFELSGSRRLGVLATEGEVTAVVDVVTVAYADGEIDLYQLPLALYTEPQDRLGHAWVGSWEDPERGVVHVYDAVHDREAMAGWLRGFDTQPDGDLIFRRLPGHDLDLEAHSTLFSGEQSNSSLAFGEDALLKVFRRLTPGPNPDIGIHEVLTRAGSTNVARLYGWLECGFETGAGAPSSTSGGGEMLQLAMLQEFFRTASDGWDLALASVRNLFAEADLYAEEVGGDFASESARLGATVADIHTLLREEFPSSVRSAGEQTELAASMSRRLDAARHVVPGLEPYAVELDVLFAAAGGLDGTAVQQVHGDLHLGQTLRTARGWKVVDFEGEPSKSLAERALPDSAWRDVAGMLRSFDYASHVVEMTAASTDDTGSRQRHFRAEEWARRNQNAFLDAYADRALTDDERTLLAAYTADKAVYECVYEARNRPGWVGIPLAAIDRIIAS